MKIPSPMIEAAALIDDLMSDKNEKYQNFREENEMMVISVQGVWVFWDYPTREGSQAFEVI